MPCPAVKSAIPPKQAKAIAEKLFATGEKLVVVKSQSTPADAAKELSKADFKAA